MKRTDSDTQVPKVEAPRSAPESDMLKNFSSIEEILQQTGTSSWVLLQQINEILGDEEKAIQVGVAHHLANKNQQQVCMRGTFSDSYTSFKYLNQVLDSVDNIFNDKELWKASDEHTFKEAKSLSIQCLVVLHFGYGLGMKSTTGEMRERSLFKLRMASFVFNNFKKLLARCRDNGDLEGEDLILGRMYTPLFLKNLRWSTQNAIEKGKEYINDHGPTLSISKGNNLQCVKYLEAGLELLNFITDRIQHANLKEREWQIAHDNVLDFLNEDLGKKRMVAYDQGPPVLDSGPEMDGAHMLLDFHEPDPDSNLSARLSEVTTKIKASPYLIEKVEKAASTKRRQPPPHPKATDEKKRKPKRALEEVKDGVGQNGGKPPDGFDTPRAARGERSKQNRFTAASSASASSPALFASASSSTHASPPAATILQPVRREEYAGLFWRFCGVLQKMSAEEEGIVSESGMEAVRNALKVARDSLRPPPPQREDSSSWSWCQPDIVGKYALIQNNISILLETTKGDDEKFCIALYSLDLKISEILYGGLRGGLSASAGGVG